MPINGTNSVQGKLGAAIKQDPKKAGMLVVLVAVLLVLWAKMMLTGGGAPKSAAGMTLAPSAQASVQVHNNGPKVRDNSALLREWLGEPMPQGVSRNIFEVKLDYYPMDTAHVQRDSRTIDDPTFWEKLAKSIDAQADQQHKRENLIQNVRQHAGQLQVTSILMGSRPKAMINGVLIGEGEVVAGFRVLEIKARSVIVEREGIKLEIPMK
jgi:hypothetical protein